MMMIRLLKIVVSAGNDDGQRMASGRNVVLVGGNVGLVGCSFHVDQNGFKAIFSAGSLPLSGTAISTFGHILGYSTYYVKNV